MSSIGAQTFIGVHGVVAKDRQQVVEITQPFVNGSAFQRIGRRARDSELETSVDTTSLTLAEAIVRAYEAMCGTVTTVVNYDVAKANVMIIDVQTKITGGINGNGGLVNGAYLVDALWLVRYIGPTS